ncbi:MAG: alpha/beta hydrolase [Promethearchaeota archaeon]
MLFNQPTHRKRVRKTSMIVFFLIVMISTTQGLATTSFDGGIDCSTSVSRTNHRLNRETREAPYCYSARSITDNFAIYSNIVGENYTIYVDLPLDYETNVSQEYPIIYLLDGDWHFQTTAHIISTLRATNDLPAVILAGIGYGGGIIDEDRRRDFIESPDDFYDFLKTELTPYLDTHFRTNTSERTLIGHSYGGFFALDALFRYRPSEAILFTNFIAISPYGDYPFLLEYESEMHDAVNGILPLKLYLAAAANDYGNIAPTVNGTLKPRLENRNYEDFRFECTIYAGLDHSTVLGPSIEDGLKWCYAPIQESTTSLSFSWDFTLIISIILGIIVIKKYKREKNINFVSKATLSFRNHP